MNFLCNVNQVTFNPMAHLLDMFAQKPIWLPLLLDCVE